MVVSGDGGGGYSPTWVICTLSSSLMVVGLRVVLRLWRFVSHTCRRHNIFFKLSITVMPS